MTDPRIAALVEFRNPRPNTKRRIAGTWPGDENSPLGKLTQEVVDAGEALLHRAYEVRANRNFSPAETGQRLREAAGPTLQTLNSSAKKLAEAKAKVREQQMRLSPVRPYAELPASVFFIDMKLLDRFEKMSLPTRAAMLHEMRLDPTVHLAYSEALLRLPRELCGIDFRTRKQIEVGLLKVFKRAEFDCLDTQIEQLRVAEATLRMGIEVARDPTGSMSDMAHHAPAAFGFYTGTTGDAEPLQWIPPEATENQAIEISHAQDT